MGIPFSSIATAEGSTPPPTWSKPWWWRIPKFKAPPAGPPPLRTAPTPTPSSKAPPPPPTAPTPMPSPKAPLPTPTAPTPPPIPSPSCRCSPEPQLAFLQKLMLVSAAAVPPAMPCIPFFVYLKTGSIETSVSIFRTPTLYAGAVNCIIWLFYSQIVRIIDLHADELVISNCFSLAFDYSFLMIAYGSRRSVWRGVLLTMIVVPAIVYLFIALRFELTLHESWGVYLAGLGFITILVCHASQVMDIAKSRGELGETLITAVNILPSLIFNGCVCYWTWVISPDQHFVLWFQSLLNLLFCTLEMVMLIMNGLRRRPAVEVMVNGDEGGNDDLENQVPLMQGQGDISNSTSASGSSSAPEPSASRSPIAPRCSTPDASTGLLMAPTLLASTSAGMAITSAPEIVEVKQGLTQPAPMDEMLDTAPLFGQHDCGKISETSPTCQIGQKAQRTERA